MFDLIFEVLVMSFLEVIGKGVRFIYRIFKKVYLKLKNNLFFIASIFMLISCESNTKLNDVDVAKIMQLKIDSSTYLYDKIIQSIKQGMSYDSAITIYKETIDRQERECKFLFDEFTLKGKRGEITQVEYDKTMKRIFLDSLQSKVKMLDSLR